MFHIKRIIALLLCILFLTLGCSDKDEKAWIQEHLGETKIVKSWDKNVIENIHKAILVKNENNQKLVQFVQVQGFHDVISLGVVFDLYEEKIKEVVIINQNETPEYGGYIQESWFTERFKNKSIKIPLKTVVMMDKNSNEIVAVTAATISSTAVTEAVNMCIENVEYLQLQKGDYINE